MFTLHSCANLLFQTFCRVRTRHSTMQEVHPCYCTQGQRRHKRSKQGPKIAARDKTPLTLVIRMIDNFNNNLESVQQYMIDVESVVTFTNACGILLFSSQFVPTRHGTHVGLEKHAREREGYGVSACLRGSGARACACQEV